MTEPAETGAVATDGETAGAAPDDAASTDGGATGVAPDDAETGATETAPEVEPRPWEVPEGHSPAPVERLEWQVKLDVVGCATQVVEGYRQAGAVLVHAGWVDLLGRVWGCVASGPGWVDVCLVRETDAGSSEVEVARMEVAEWERAYAG